MKRLDRIQLGKWVRKIRKAKRLRQEDLVDEILSQTAISNIESGKTHVSEEKLAHLLNKLGYTIDELSNFYMEEEQDTEYFHEELELRLLSIENTIDLVDPDDGLEAINHLGIPDDSSYQVIAQYLRGKCYMHKKNWNKAHKHFFDCIHSLIHHHPEMQYTNLKPACYLKLSVIEFLQNNYREALLYSIEGLNSFLKDGQREYLEEMLLINKAIYLEKLNRIEDAQFVLEEITHLKTKTYEQEKEKMEFPLYLNSKEVMLNFMELQANFFMKNQLYCQAIKYTLKGIELARIDRMYNRSFELWIALGNIYLKLEQMQLAEICFLTALKLRKKIDQDHLLAYVYIQLGRLYKKRKIYHHTKQYLLEALRISHKKNDAFWEVESLTELGLYYWEQQDHENAMKHLQQALKLAKAQQMNKQENRLFLIIGNLLYKRGDSGYEKYAINFFKSHLNTLKGDDKQIRV